MNKGSKVPTWAIVILVILIIGLIGNLTDGSSSSSSHSNPGLFGWIVSLGKDVKVVGPSEVVEQMRDAAKDFMANLN